jgi:hypothetical protein
VAAANFFTFDSYLTELAKGKNGTLIDMSTDTLSVYLSNATPNRATRRREGDLAEITAKNGYAGMVDVTLTSRGIYNNTYRFIANDIEWTGTDATDNTGFGPFRYILLLSKTSSATDSSRRLIGYWAYPSAQTVAKDGVVKVDWSAIDGALRIR